VPAHRDRGRRHYLDGPAAIVVEIAAPESVHRHRVEKVAEYEPAGVPEYWLVDPDRQQVDPRVLGPEGRHRVVFAGPEWRGSGGTPGRSWTRSGASSVLTLPEGPPRRRTGRRGAGRRSNRRADGTDNWSVIMPTPISRHVGAHIPSQAASSAQRGAAN
jgi:Putative restriction endonuclease